MSFKDDVKTGDFLVERNRAKGRTLHRGGQYTPKRDQGPAEQGTES